MRFNPTIPEDAYNVKIYVDGRQSEGNQIFQHMVDVSVDWDSTPVNRDSFIQASVSFLEDLAEKAMASQPASDWVVTFSATWFVSDSVSENYSPKYATLKRAGVK